MQIELEDGLFLASIRVNESWVHKLNRKCPICGKDTGTMRYKCPNNKFDALGYPDNLSSPYWRRFFAALRLILADKELNSLIVCSKQCWIELIAPIRSDLLLYICRLDSFKQ